ncbi:hypothetical protein [Tepidibacter hydrothermalis]|uniref:Phage shock protein B n=1 Tax=Tepidibacter hydrothermalis TaxID=3036126 RepID=A0ABY8EDL6_9FIRM|nr:hypothetical protein [Tepidibacter hydrothermalis]WFD11033.1 hypothetical protein P4S50_02865 [Tepidibacter hydrothermalis]
MALLFSGINIIILLIIMSIPVAVGYYAIKFLKNKEENKDELLVRIVLLEKRVKELEDYINDSE